MAVRLALLAIVAALLAGVTALWALPAQLDPARVRAALEQIAAERLHAAVTIEGPVRFALLPRPMLQAARVSLLHGSPGDADALAVTAETLVAQLQLSALWHGRLAASDLILDAADVQAPFPLDIRVLTSGRADSLRSTSITLRRSRIRIGPVTADQVDASLTADRVTGDVAGSGTFRLPSGSAWRARLRLSPPGGDGSAALDASADGLYAADAPTMALTGQLAGDGGFSGRLSASGPSLARLTVAPPVAFSATGRASLADGVLAVDDMALSLDTAPARLDGSLRLSPQPRLELRLIASRLDLDAWRLAIAAAPTPALVPLPLSLDLTSEAASLSGGLLRQMRACLSQEGSRLTLESVEAVLPGGMTVRAEGVADFAAGTSRFALQADGGDPRAAAAWLGGVLDVSSIPLPETAFRSLTGRASLESAGREIEAHGLSAVLDGVALRGDILVSLPDKSTARAGVAAVVTLDRLDVAPWLALWRKPAPPGPPLPVDLTLQLTTPDARVPGLPTASLDLDVSARAGALDVRRLKVVSAGWRLEAVGSRSDPARWSGVSAAFSADRLETLAPAVPPSWREAVTGIGHLAAQPIKLRLLGSGAWNAAEATLEGELGETHIAAALNLQRDERRTMTSGTVALRHPSARAAGELFGVDTRFLGDGDVAASAEGDLGAGVLTARAVRLRAGGLDVGGRLRLDVTGPEPIATGRLEASALVLPGLDVRATAPWSIGLLRGWRADLDLAATRAETPGLKGRGLADLHGHMTLASGVLKVDDFAAAVPGGGTVTGTGQIDSSTVPPRAEVDMDWTALGAALSSGSLEVRLDNFSGAAHLQARGFAPAAMLATMQGDVHAAASAGRLNGADFAQLGGQLADAAVRAALAEGVTPLQSPTLSGVVEHGLTTLQGEALGPEGARVAIGGTVDLPDARLNLNLVVVPAVPDPPRIGLRLSGPVGAAAATPDLLELDRWRLARSPGFELR